MHKKLLLVALVVALTAPSSAVAQSAAAQDAAFTYLTNLPADFHMIAASALKAKLDAGQKPFILDVRDPASTAQGYIPGATLIPSREVAKNLGKLPPKNAEIVVYCVIGQLSSYVVMALGLAGYTNVKGLLGGYNEWVAQKYPVAK